jgi:hypothetical protein
MIIELTVEVESREALANILRNGAEIGLYEYHVLNFRCVQPLPKQKEKKPMKSVKALLILALLFVCSTAFAGGHMAASKVDTADTVGILTYVPDGFDSVAGGIEWEKFNPLCPVNFSCALANSDGVAIILHKTIYGVTLKTPDPNIKILAGVDVSSRVPTLEDVVTLELGRKMRKITASKSKATGSLVILEDETTTGILLVNIVTIDCGDYTVWTIDRAQLDGPKAGVTDAYPSFLATLWNQHVMGELAYVGKAIAAKDPNISDDEQKTIRAKLFNDVKTVDKEELNKISFECNMNRLKMFNGCFGGMIKAECTLLDMPGLPPVALPKGAASYYFNPTTGFFVWGDNNPGDGFIKLAEYN